MGESRQNCRSGPMMRSTSLPPNLRVAITSRRLLKVIAGLTNLDPVAVLMIARGAAAGGSDLVDIACEPALVRAVAEVCPQLPICVSAVDPELFPAAMAAGAAMVEIGKHWGHDVIDRSGWKHAQLTISRLCRHTLLVKTSAGVHEREHISILRREVTRGRIVV